jgi:hypothetical protein
MCKKCEGKKCEDKKNRNKLYNHHQHFGVVNTPNYSVEIINNNYDSTLQIRNSYEKSVDLYNILVN